MKIINLLPPSEAENLKQIRTFSWVRTFVIASVGVYILVVLLLIGYRFYMASTLSGLDSQISAEKKIISQANNIVLQKQIDDTNHIIGDYNKLSDQNPNWSKILKGFANLVPQGIYIQGFTANADTGMVQVTGVAATRQEVLDLHASIAASPLFRDIDLPLDNLQKPTNVSFHYTFYVTNGSLSANWKPLPPVDPNAKATPAAGDATAPATGQ